MHREGGGAGVEGEEDRGRGLDRSGGEVPPEKMRSHYLYTKVLVASMESACSAVMRDEDGSTHVEAGLRPEDASNGAKRSD